MRRAFVSALLAAAVTACGDDGKVTEPTTATKDAAKLGPLTAIGTDSVTGATIETNLDDYLPGGTVSLVGRDWAPNETVHLMMSETPDSHPDVSADVQADSTGGFSVEFYVVQESDFGATFTLTATGETSGSSATATFTDGNFAMRAAFSPSGGPSFNGTLLKFPQSTACDPASNGQTATTGAVTTAGGPSTGVNENQSARMTVPASVSGYAFSTWTVAGGTVTLKAGSALTDPSICIEGTAASSARTFTANYVAVASVGTTTMVAASPTPSVFGESVTFTATVTPASGPAATGTVNFYEFTGVQSCSALGGAVALGSDASAPFEHVTSALAVGSHTITACYVPNAGWAASDGNTTHVVGKADVDVAVSDAPPSSSVGQNVTFTATVTAKAPGVGTPGGTVTFYEFTGEQTCTNLLGASPLGSDNTAPFELVTSSLSAGNHTITACYGGDGNFNPGSGRDDHPVDLNATTTAITSSVNPTVTGQSTTFTATVKDAANAAVTSGTITFKEGGANCSDAAASTFAGPTAVNGSGQATTSKAYNASESPKAIHACYSGTSAYAASENSLTQTINKGQTTTTVTALPASPSVFGQSVTFTATVAATSPASGTPAGIVDFFNGGSCASPGATIQLNVALSVSSQASISTSSLAVGPHAIVACYSGSLDFETSSGTLAYTVDKASTTMSLASSGSPSTFGDPVTFTATVSVVSPGAGTPSGTVNFADGGSCDATTGVITGGTSLGSVALAAGSAQVTTSTLAAGSHTIVGCYGGSANFNGSGKTLSQTVNPKPTSTTVTVETTTPQYSDKVKVKAVVAPHTVASSELTGTVTFYVNGSVNCAAPPATSVGSDAITAADDGVAELEYQVLSAAGSYTVTGCFVSSNANFANSSGSVGITVGKEDATVATGSPYGNSFAIGSGGTASLTHTFTVREPNPEPDVNAGALPGDVDNTGLTVALNAVGNGANNKTMTCTPSAVIATPPAYADVKTYTCQFTNVAVDAYEVDADVTGSYYVGGYIDALTVYDPGAGFVTGGGKFVYPDASNERVSFGLSFTFTGKGKTIPRGNLVVIRHLTNGDICRAKSNAIDAPAVVGKTASFSGKGNYACVRPTGETYDGVGNQTMLGWVEDNGEGSTAIAADRFWINMNVPSSKLLIAAPASTNARSLTGGNVQVPQPSSGK